MKSITNLGLDHLYSPQEGACGGLCCRRRSWDEMD